MGKKAGKSSASLLPALITSAVTIVVSVILTATGMYSIKNQSLPTATQPVPLTTNPVSTPISGVSYANNYPPGGIEQNIISDTIKGNMDMLDSIFSWAILISLGIGWAGLIKQGDIEIIGLKVQRKYAFFLVSALYLTTNFAILIILARIGELLLLLDSQNFINGLSKITTHTWLLNPYSFLGTSLLSRSFNSLGYGLLIFCWWICYTSLYLLRDGKDTFTSRILPIAFLVLGILALIIINRNYSIILFRLSSVNYGFYNAISVTTTERSVASFVGIALGVLVFVVSTKLQSNLAKSNKLPISKGNDNENELVHCPECNLPFKTKNDLSIHIKNWHAERNQNGKRA